MSPAEMVRAARRSAISFAEDHIVHAMVVVIVIVAATVYAAIGHDRSGNVWIVYGSAIGYAAGRSGAMRRLGIGETLHGSET